MNILGQAILRGADDSVPILFIDPNIVFLKQIQHQSDREVK